MSFVSTVIGTAERVPLPDVVIRAAIQLFCARTATKLANADAASDAAFAGQMAARAILTNRSNSLREAACFGRSCDDGLTCHFAIHLA